MKTSLYKRDATHTYVDIVVRSPSINEKKALRDSNQARTDMININRYFFHTSY